MKMSSDDAITWLNTDDCESKGFADATSVAIDTMRKYQQLEDFARWVAVEVIDEELWTYNHLAFAEIACRKLVKLGIMQESDGEYTYEVIEE
jgi:hypothetical protein